MGLAFRRRGPAYTNVLPMTRERIIYVKEFLNHSGGAEQVLVQTAMAAQVDGYAPVVVTRSSYDPGNKYAQTLGEHGIPVVAPSLRTVAMRTAATRALAWCLRVLLCPFYMARRRVGPVRAWERVSEELSVRVTYPARVRVLDSLLATHLSRLHARERVALVHAHNTDQATPTAVRWAASHHVPAISHDHCGPRRPRFFERSLWAYSPEDIQLIARHALVVVLTPEICRAARPAYGDQAHMVVVPNWVDPPECPTQTERRADGFLVGTVTRVSPQKGVEALVEAVAILRGQGATLQCIIAGGGSIVEEIEQGVRAQGLEEAIAIRRNLKRSEVWALLSQLDVFVLASEDEGMPMSILEAMAAGLPIVATTVGGIPEMLENEGSALLVPPRDPGALAEALARLAGDKKLRERLGKAARDRFERCYTREAVWPQVDALYRSLLEGQAEKNA